MITIKNYTLGEGKVFLAWRLNSVTETNDSYVFLWTGRTGHQYQIHLGRRFENAKGELPMMMFTTTPGTQPLWSGVVNRSVLELHWEWLDKSIRVMNQYKPYK
jgi:hypothetical protein